VLLVVGLLELLLFLVVTLCWAIGFVVTTALGAHLLESHAARLALGLVLTVVLPLVWYGRLHRRIKSIGRAPASFVALCSAFIGVSLALGFADDVGRALRRHGDWFLGERNGAVARLLRAGVTVVAARLERFDPPREVDPVILPPDPTLSPRPYGPFRPGEEPPPPQPTIVGWFHPLAGGERAMPGSESRRFGATRPQPRPSECELGHCGVDLGYALGQAVVAIHDGVVERIELDEQAGGRAGRYVRIGHKDGTVVSRYVHLDSVRADLKVGMSINGGELIGRVGRTGVEHSGPHLHFGLSLRPGGKHGTPEKYVDPEPLLRGWALAPLPQLGTAVALLQRPTTR
jgi:murein DD-endopeptidase MepM/ murein hydrolase activator NlpD